MGTMMSFVFGAGVWGQNLFYDTEFFRSKKLSGPVLSIGTSA